MLLHIVFLTYTFHDHYSPALLGAWSVRTRRNAPANQKFPRLPPVTNPRRDDWRQGEDHRGPAKVAPWIVMNS